MSLQVKICGLTDAEALAAAVIGGAAFVGFVFCSSRHRIELSLASRLAKHVPNTVRSVGLFVDPSDDELRATLDAVPLNVLQLHGSESIQRVIEIKSRFGLPIIKAVGIAAPQDVASAQSFEGVAEWLLLDAKPRRGGPTGGNGISFDWSMLTSAKFSTPWLLAGGLNPLNIEEAVRYTGARILDVSTGVEDAQGRKDPAKILAFLRKAQSLETSY